MDYSNKRNFFHPIRIWALLCVCYAYFFSVSAYQATHCLESVSLSVHCRKTWTQYIYCNKQQQYITLHVFLISCSPIDFIHIYTHTFLVDRCYYAISQCGYRHIASSLLQIQEPFIKRTKEDEVNSGFILKCRHAGKKWLCLSKNIWFFLSCVEDVAFFINRTWSFLLW